jgi:hypothetical protein
MCCKGIVPDDCKEKKEKKEKEKKDIRIIPLPDLSSLKG